MSRGNGGPNVHEAYELEQPSAGPPRAFGEVAFEVYAKLANLLRHAAQRYRGRAQDAGDMLCSQHVFDAADWLEGLAKDAIQLPGTDEPAIVDGESIGVCPEIEEAHNLLDAIGADSRAEPLVDRLKSFIRDAAGERVAARLEPDFGTALSRYHLERSGHPVSCPCNPCRQARLIK